MPEVGMDGQRKLKAASILLIGTGGLGSPLGLYLAAAGVGRLGLVDFDVVDFSNLQRQILYRDSDIGQFKAEAAARHHQRAIAEARGFALEEHSLALYARCAKTDCPHRR